LVQGAENFESFIDLRFAAGTHPAAGEKESPAIQLCEHVSCPVIKHGNVNPHEWSFHSWEKHLETGKLSIARVARESPSSENEQPMA